MVALKREDEEEGGFVMLAADGTEADFQFPCILSPKIDGFRIYVKDGVARTRSGKRLANRASNKFFSVAALNGLDGEMVVGSPNAEDTFNTSQRGLTTEGFDPKAKYLVFDVHDMSASFSARVKEVERRVAKLPPPMCERVICVAQAVARNIDELRKFQRSCLDAGFEGIIVRSPDARYKHGRSTVAEGGMLKLKLFVDSEAVCVGMEEEIDKHGKPKGTCGSLIGIDLKTEIEFSCAGISRARKAELWELGERLNGLPFSYRYTPCGTRDRPRHPRFKGMRDPRDMDPKLVKQARKLSSPKFRLVMGKVVV